MKMPAMTRSLKRVRRRLRQLRALHCIDIGLTIAAVATALTAALSYFVPFSLSLLFAAFLLFSPVVLALLSFALPVSAMRAAQAADACGLKERTQTALECADDTPMSSLQREDAQHALDALDLRKAMPYQGPKLWVKITYALAMTALFVMSFIPNPQDAVLREQDDLRVMLSQHADKIDEAAKALPEDAQDAQTDELMRLSKSLSQSLRQADSKTDALLAANKAEEDFKRLEVDRAQSLREKAAQALASAGLPGLAEAMRSGNAEAAAQAASSLGAQAASSKADAQALSEALENAADALSSDDAQSAEALQNAAQAMTGATSASASAQALSAAMSQLASAASSNSASNNLKASLSALRAALAGSSGANSNGSGGGSSNGKGSGGSGISQSQGQGSGSGASLGTTNQDAGYFEGGQKRTSDGNGPLIYKTGAYESIYDPTRLGDSGDISQVQGEVREGEVNQVQLAPGQGVEGERVPYNQVIGAYSQSAAQAATLPSMPAHVKQWVDQYFGALIDSAGG